MNIILLWAFSMGMLNESSIIQDESDVRYNSISTKFELEGQLNRLFYLGGTCDVHSERPVDYTGFKPYKGLFIIDGGIRFPLNSNYLLTLGAIHECDHPISNLVNGKVDEKQAYFSYSQVFIKIGNIK